MVFIKKVIEKPLGEILVEAGVLKKEQVREALQVQKQSKDPIGKILVSLGFIKEEDIVYAISLQYGFPYLPLDNYEIEERVVKEFPYHLPYKYKVIPIDIVGKILICATPDPLDRESLGRVEEETGLDLQIFICTESEYRRALEKYFPQGKESLEAKR